MEHRIVVMPPGDTGGRVVRVDNELLGTAYRMADLLEFLRRAGLAPDSVSVLDPDLFDWRGGGPEVWWLHGAWSHDSEEGPPATGEPAHGRGCTARPRR